MGHVGGEGTPVTQVDITSHHRTLLAAEAMMPTDMWMTGKRDLSLGFELCNSEAIKVQSGWCWQ